MVQLMRMIVHVEHNGRNFQADLSEGIDLSIALMSGNRTVNAFGASDVMIEPVRQGAWIGEVAKGAAVNYRNIRFNPHGNGTHTECVGHIDEMVHSVNHAISRFHMVARLFSVTPEIQDNGDRVVTAGILETVHLDQTEAVIVRTLPNSEDKRSMNHTGRNPAYLHHSTVELLVKNGCRHLILDLPSIDREQDAGKLLAHRAFWQYPDNTRMDATITELAFVPDTVPDGLYLLNLQVAPFENDASPSRPVIFPLRPVTP